MPWPEYVDPDGPPQLDDPVQQAAVNKAMARDLGLRVTGLPVGLVASTLNDQNATGLMHYVPMQGAAANVVGMAHTLLDMNETIQRGVPGIKYMPPIIGGFLPLPQSKTDESTPWLQAQINRAYPYLEPAFKWADRVTDETTKRAEGMVPHMEPRNVGEQEALRFGESVGSVGLPITKLLGPGARIAEAAMPSIVKQLMPGLTHASAPIAGVGLTGAFEALHDLTRKPTDPQPSDSLAPVIERGQSSLLLPADQPTYLPPGQIPGEGVPFTLPPPSFDGSAPIPDFMQQGQSSTSFTDVGKAFGEAMILGLGMRFSSRLGKSVRDAERARMYAEDSRAFNDAETRRAMNDPASTSMVQPDAPLPSTGGPIHDAAVRANDYWLDSNAQVKAAIDAWASSPDIASELKYRTGNANNQSLSHEKIGEYHRTGVHEDTQIRVDPLEPWSREVGRLSPDKQQQLARAIAFEDEKNNRDNLAKQMIQNGTYNPNLGTEQFHHNYYHIPTPDMIAEIAAARADPILHDLMERRISRNRGELLIAVDQGYITRAEMGQFIHDHPNYMPSADETGRITHIFGPRELSTNGGNRSIPTQPWELDKQKSIQLMRAIEKNTNHREIVAEARASQGRNPDHARVFTLNTDPTTGAPLPGGKGEPVLELRDHNGRSYVRVGNNTVWNWMTNSDAQTKIGMDVVGHLRRFYTSGTTGFWSLARASVFPLINIPRITGQLATNRPFGMAGGLIDKGVQAVTSKLLPKQLQFGWTVLDPTTPAGLAFTLVDDLTNQFAVSAAHLLDSRNLNGANKVLRASFGDNFINLLQQTLASKYLASDLHGLRARGLAGAGSGGNVEIPRNQPGAAAREFAMINNRVPQTYRMSGPGGRATPYLLRSTNLLREMYNIINDLPLSYGYRLNKNNPRMSKAGLDYELRDISGDPGISGSGSAARAAANAIPYGNVSAQGVRRQVQAGVQNPLGVGVGVGGSLLALSMYQLLSASAQGPEAVKNLTDELSLQQRAANPTFYWHGGAFKFSLPQEWRGPYAIALEMASTLLHANEAHKNEDAWNWMSNVLHDFGEHHISNSSIESAKHGVADASLLSLPPVVNAGLSASGVSVHPEGLITGDKIIQNTNTPETTPNRVPDAILDNSVGKTIRSMVSAFGGVLTMAAEMAGVGERQARAGAGAGDVLSAMGGEWMQKLRDSNPSVVWNNTARLANKNPYGEMVMRRFENMKQTANSEADIHGAGTTRSRGGVEIEQGQQSKVPTDPEMLSMYVTIDRTTKTLQERFMPAIHDIQKQMQVMESQALPPDVRRDMHNRYVRDMNDKYEDLYKRMVALNTDLSIQYKRHIDAGAKIDWSKGMEQFPLEIDPRAAPPFK